MKQTLTNFGGNQKFQPEYYYTPRSEAEVLDILRRHPGDKIRAIGRLHSWSQAAVGHEVVIDMRWINQVSVSARDDRSWAQIGAGCQIKRALAELERHGDLTLPTLGLISEQALAGAMSTATHGSGRHSLAHYADEIRVAVFDPETGEPIIRTVSSGPELLALRCSLGCVGIILSVGLFVRKQYLIEEHLQRYETLDEVLQQEADFPLQQFFLIPWLWKFYSQHRRESATPRRWSAGLYRIYWFLCMDLGLHLAILFLVKLCRSRWGVRFFFRRVLPWTVIRNWRVVDRSSDMLIMEHELFRHIEIEIFVRRSNLADALSLTRSLLDWAGTGDEHALSMESWERLAAAGCGDAVKQLRGRYLHHYPICVRRVLPDDAYLSMSSDFAEDSYALSFISYQWISDRAGFEQFANCLALSFARLFAARPHWGKFCPLPPEQLRELYPRWSEFQAVCEKLDGPGRFRNPWLENILDSRAQKP